MSYYKVELMYWTPYMLNSIFNSISFLKTEMMNGGGEAAYFHVSLDLKKYGEYIQAGLMYA